MIGGSWLTENAFRVLGISADASASDMHKAAAKARRALSLGLEEISEADLPQLGPCLRTEATIRTALGQLLNPAERLTHRLFWFYSRQSKSANDAFGNHDHCLARFVKLTTTEAARFEPKDWKTALLNWWLFLSRDDYWELTTALEISGQFEPSAYSSEVDILRHTAVAIAAEPFIALAREAAHRDDLVGLGRSLGTLGELNGTGGWSEAAQRELGQPIMERFESLCSSIQSEVGDGIVRENHAATNNRWICDAANKRYQTEVKPHLETLLGAFKDTHWLSDACREAAAQCLGSIGMGYTWADQFVTAEEMYRKALELAQDTLAAPALQQALARVNSGAHHQRTVGKPIQSAPSLSTVNGIGLRLYGQSDVDNDTGSYSSNHYFTFLYFPIVPVGRYRVISTGTNSYRFLGKLPFRKYEKWHLGIAVSILAIFGVSIFFESPQRTDTGNITSSSADSASSSTDASVSKSPDLNTAASVPANPADRDGTKAQIDAGRTRIAELETTLSPTLARMKSLGEQMTEIKGELEALDASKAAGTPIDIERYNSLVDSFNNLLYERRGLVNTTKNQLDEYNGLLNKDKSMVAQYNAIGSQP